MPVGCSTSAGRLSPWYWRRPPVRGSDVLSDVHTRGNTAPPVHAEEGGEEGPAVQMARGSVKPQFHIAGAVFAQLVSLEKSRICNLQSTR